VMKVYRDWKISGDGQWLRDLWPLVRRSLEFAWSPANEDQWDPQRTGVLWGRQHHTLDMELFGPNAWLTGFYLGALKAGAEMAAFVGEEDQAAEYRALFAKGKVWTDQHLFNGEYYQQQVDLGDRQIAARFGVEGAYWSEEHGELKYQVGQGCGLDQVLAQWHANLYGLGEIFDPKQTRQALRAIFKHNFKQPLRDHYNPCRVYALNDEGGLVICEWPKGRPKPMIPLTYAQETMNGFEYAAAIQMIQSSLVQEGARAVAAIRQRYDGERRNPWNEFECGSNYARSMASYALLNAYSGLRFDLAQGYLGFDPVVPGRFRCFWSLGTGWGMLAAGPGRAGVEVRQGRLTLRTLELPFLRGRPVRRVALGGREVDLVQEGNSLRLKRPARLAPGRSLEVRFKK